MIINLDYVPGNGACLFTSVANQLQLKKGIEVSAQTLRNTVVDHMKEKRDRMSGEDRVNLDGMLTLDSKFNCENGEHDVAGYFEKMKERSTYGGAAETQAIAELYKVNISVWGPLSPQKHRCRSVDQSGSCRSVYRNKQHVYLTYNGSMPGGAALHIWYNKSSSKFGGHYQSVASGSLPLLDSMVESTRGVWV